MRTLYLTVALLCMLLARPCVAQQSQQILCDDAWGTRYGVYQSPTFGMRLAIAPVAWGQGPERMLVPANHPLISLAFAGPDNAALLIARNGALIAYQNGQFFSVGYCAVTLVGINVPNPPQGAIWASAAAAAATPMAQNPRILSSRGTDVASLSASGNVAVQHWPMNISETQAVACARENGVNEDDFMQCMTDRMLTAKQRRAVACVTEHDDDALGAGGCVASIAAPGLAPAIKTIQSCMTDGETDWDCLAQGSLSAQQYAAYQCVADSEDKSDIGDCVAAAGGDPKAAKLISTAQKCYDKFDDAQEAAFCVMKQNGDRSVVTAVRCVEEQADNANFSYVGAAICYAGNSFDLNPELQIAVSCVEQSGGEPYAYAGCVGGRLTARELSKCLTQGVGGNGCFGPNNEIVKALRSAGVDVSDVTNPNGELVRAWNTASNDLRNGPGPNNDLVRMINDANNTVSGAFGPNNDAVKVVNNAVGDILHGPGPNNDALKAANQIGQGVADIAGQAQSALGHIFGW